MRRPPTRRPWVETKSVGRTLLTVQPRHGHTRITHTASAVYETERRLFADFKPARRGGPPEVGDQRQLPIHCRVPDSTKAARRFFYFFPQRGTLAACETAPGVTRRGGGSTGGAEPASTLSPNARVHIGNADAALTSRCAVDAWRWTQPAFTYVPPKRDAVSTYGSLRRIMDASRSAAASIPDRAARSASAIDGRGARIFCAPHLAHLAWRLRG